VRGLRSLGGLIVIKQYHSGNGVLGPGILLARRDFEKAEQRSADSIPSGVSIFTHSRLLTELQLLWVQALLSTVGTEFGGIHASGSEYLRDLSVAPQLSGPFSDPGTLSDGRKTSHLGNRMALRSMGGQGAIRLLNWCATRGPRRGGDSTGTRNKRRPSHA
jgi:hypothetical protein